jgi:hypothetical protein
VTEDFIAGRRSAFAEMLHYTTSMVITDPDPEPWVDMSFYAHTSIEDIDDGIDLAEDYLIESDDAE